MKQLLYVFIILIAPGVALCSSTKDQLDKISSLLGKDLDSAYNLSQELLLEFENNDDVFGIVRANYYLGWITKQQGEYGKSVIYYLEAIRQADKTEYEGIIQDKINLRRNLANTFRIFESNNLATIYNLEAIDIATEHDFKDQAVDLKFNQALVYQNNSQYREAETFYVEVLAEVSGNTEYISRIKNQLGLIYLEEGDYEKAKPYFNELLDIPENLNVYTAKALHNLGEIDYESGELITAIENLEDAIDILENIENVNKYSLFISYRNIGRYLFEADLNSKAKQYLQKAEAIASYAEWDASSFEIYKTFSDLYYSEGNNALGKQYSETYFNKIQEYIETQEDLQKKDKEYNFDLITKRYFDEVEKQERIASIMFWSKLSSGSLLTILLLVIAFNRYEKLKLRKTIERELINLRIIE